MGMLGTLFGQNSKRTEQQGRIMICIRLVKAHENVDKRYGELSALSEPLGQSWTDLSMRWWLAEIGLPQNLTGSNSAHAAQA